MINIKILNAIYIKQKTLMTSVAIQLCLFLLLLASSVLSFYPWLSNQFFVKEQLRLSISGVEIDQDKLTDVIITNESPDAVLEYSQQLNIYNITLNTEKGRNSLENIKTIVFSMNIENLLKNVDLTPQEFQMMQNSNIDIDDRTDYMQIGEEQYIFMMTTVLMYFIMCSVLISRIGAQVAYEKGNQVTEVILTSLTRGQLYLTDVVAGFLVSLVNMVVISIPMVIASLIHNDNIASSFLFLYGMNAFWLLMHMVLSIFSIIIICIGLCSVAKRAEDSNAFSIIMMIPVLISYIYTIVNQSLFTDIWKVLNYIPFFSIFPILTGIITSSINSYQMIVYIIIDLLLISVELYLTKFLYVKNISKE